MTPNESKYGYAFSIGENNLHVGLHSLHDTHPDALTPVLLLAKGSDWEEVTRYDTLWKDVQEDIYPDPEKMATDIIKKFNTDLKQFAEGGEMTWNQKLGSIFQLRLALVTNQLVINPA